MTLAGARRPCPGCGRGDTRPLRRYRAARLARCRACGLVAARELPTAAGLDEHYGGYPECGPLPELTDRRYREVLSRLQAFRDTGRLLDVGCGDGHFLLTAREQGWTVFGSEFGSGPRRRARALGLDVREAPFPASGDELASFDVVTAIEVIEHVPDPRQELARIAALLRPGGAAYLTTPNFDSLSRRLAGPRWRAVEYPEHLNLFTPATLHRLLADAGLTRLAVTTTGISPSDIRAALRRSGAPEPGGEAAPRLDERVRAGMAASPGLERGVRAANAVLGRLRAGDTIKALYRR